MNKEMIVMSATPDKVMMMVMMMLTMMITMMTMMAATEMNMIMSLVDLLSTSCHHRRPNAKPEFNAGRRYPRRAPWDMSAGGARCKDSDDSFVSSLGQTLSHSGRWGVCF